MTPYRIITTNHRVCVKINSNYKVSGKKVSLLIEFLVRFCNNGHGLALYKRRLPNSIAHAHVYPF